MITMLVKIYCIIFIIFNIVDMVLYFLIPFEVRSKYRLTRLLLGGGIYYYIKYLRNK